MTPIRRGTALRMGIRRPDPGPRFVFTLSKRIDPAAAAMIREQFERIVRSARGEIPRIID